MHGITPYIRPHPVFESEAAFTGKQTKRMQQDIARQDEILTTAERSTSYLDTEDAGLFIQSELKLSTYKVLQKGDTLLQNRSERMIVQTKEALQIVEKVKIDIMGMHGAQEHGVSAVFHANITGYLKQLSNILNQGDGTYATLSGTAVDTNPVGDLSTCSALASNSPMMYDYYNGQDGDMVITLDTVSINQYPITAKDDFFAKTIQACRICLGYNAATDDKSVLDAAQTLCESAIHTEFPRVMQTLDTEHTAIKTLLNKLPKYITDETKIREDMDDKDQLTALLKRQTLQSSIEILQQLRAQEAMFARQYADILGRI